MFGGVIGGNTFNIGPYQWPLPENVKLEGLDFEGIATHNSAQKATFQILQYFSKFFAKKEKYFHQLLWP